MEVGELITELLNCFSPALPSVAQPMCWGGLGMVVVVMAGGGGGLVVNESESGDNEAVAARRAKPQGAGSRLNPSLFISRTLLRSGRKTYKNYKSALIQDVRGEKCVCRSDMFNVSEEN